MNKAEAIEALRKQGIHPLTLEYFQNALTEQQVVELAEVKGKLQKVKITP